MRANRLWPRAIAAAALLAALACQRAGAMELAIDLGDDFTYTDAPVRMQVRITDPEKGMSAPEITVPDGLLLRGPGSVSEETQIYNGRTTRSRTIPYLLTPMPGRTGTFRIGPATVTGRGGQAVQSKTADLRVLKRPPPGILFEVRATPPGGPVGATFRVVYTILYSGDLYERSDDFFNRAPPFGLKGLEIPLLQKSGLTVKPFQVLPDVEVTPVNIQKGTQLWIQRGFAERDGAIGYKTLVFGLEATPFAPEPIDIGGASVALYLVTGGTKTTRDSFGFPREVQSVQPFEASTGTVQYLVKPLPEEGRPPGFTGAVGRYEIRVKASPTEVQAFAPITLEVSVTGEGLLEELKPPAWSEVPSLTRDFQVASDVDSGKVEGKAKVFKQTIRPTSEKVTAIPPVPFPFFNPAKGRYETALSEPIPIKVLSVKTVSSAEAIPSAIAPQSPSAATTSRPSPAAVVTRESGIGANFSDMGSPRATFDPRDEVVSAPFLATVVLPPAAWAGAALLLRWRKRDPVKRKRARALATAASALRNADTFEAVAQAASGYFRERLGLPPGEVTPSDLARSLESRDVATSVRDRTVSVLERAFAGRFGGGAESPRSLAGEAATVLEEVERCLRG